MSQCKEQVPDRDTSWPTFHQCMRKAKKDGYCTQHHPHTVARREQKSRERWEKKWNNRPAAMYNRLRSGVRQMIDEERCERSIACSDQHCDICSEWRVFLDKLELLLSDSP